MIKIDQSRVSNNYGPRKHGLPPDMVVLHYTAMRCVEDALDRLCDPSVEVSAHYVISEQGQIYQLVSEDMRAWHAGAGAWGKVTDVNSHSIGIELANATTDDCSIPFPEPQMQALEILLTDILNRLPLITADRVIGHSDMAPGRKNDPGRKFDWRRLARLNLSVWPDEQPDASANWDDFMTAARRFGYDIASDDAASFDTVLDAFRQRFAPSHFGPLHPRDVSMISTLAQAYPCKSVDLGAPIA